MKYPVVIFVLVILAQAVIVQAVNIPRYGIFELTLTASGSYSNPYLQMPGDNSTPGFVVGTFNGPDGTQIQMDGFWDGGGTWKIRMAPTAVGTWTYSTSSTDSGLNGKIGSFTCVASGSKGFPKVNPSHTHHFAYSDGTPFYWAPVTTQIANFDTRDAEGGNRRVDNGTFQALLDVRAAQGFTGTHWGYWGFNKTGFNDHTQQNEGGPPFTNYDPDFLNPSYHQYGDLRVQALQDRGIISQISLGWPDQGIESNIGHTRLKRYWRYLIARNAAYNVTWNLFGEINEFGGDWLTHADEYGNLTRDHDPYHHLLSTHTSGDPPADFCNRSWLDYVMLQRATNVTQNWLSYNKPVINSEYLGYEDFQVTGEQMRPMIWDVRMRGGYFVYESWGNDINSPGATYSKWCNLFFENRTRYWRLEYHPELFSARPGLADPGWEYIIYLSAGGGITVNLSQASGTLDVEWYNPRTGVVTPAGTTTGGGSQSFTAPDTSDWTLHIKSPDDTAPPSVPTNVQATPQSATSIQVTWTASTDIFGMMGYKIFRNGGQVGASSATSYADGGLSPLTTYSYTVSAYDEAGNNSAESSPPATATTPADTTPPSVPTNVQATSQSSTSVQITWTASTDNIGVTGYKIFRNAVQAGTSSATSYTNTGLSPHTTYSYTVSAYDAAANNSSQSTPPATATTGWRFASVADSRGGDNGVNTATLTQIVNRINVEGVDLLIFGGDSVNGSSNDATLGSQLDTWKSVMANLTCPYYISMGNHEIGGSGSEGVVRSKFEMPTNGPTGYEELVYSFDYQNAHFVCLDSDKYNDFHRVQRSWLNSDLGATTKPYTFVYAHDPAYPKGPHIGSSLDAYPTERDDFWQILTNHGVRMYFCGHEHLYARSLEGAVYQVINGTCGAPIAYGYSGTIAKYDYVIVEINGNTVNCTTRDENGSLLDSWSYERDTTPPSVPTSVTASAQSSSMIKVMWVASTDNVALIGYKLFRNGGQIVTTTSTTYTDTGLSAGTTYSYTVSAYDSVGNNSAQSSPPATAKTFSSDTEPPSVPTNVTATALSTTSIRVAWTASTDNVAVKGYYVYRNGSYLATSTTTSYTNNGLTPNTIYSYTVAAYDASRNVSAQSSPPATAKTFSNDTQPPSVPANVSATAQTPRQVKITWTASTDNVGVAGYKIFRNANQIATSSAISCTDTGLSPSTSYSYTVSAYDTSDNNSAQSSPPVTMTTMTAIDIDVAKALGDSLSVGMISKIVTAIYSGCFYIEETERYTGIKVFPIEMPGGLAVGGVVDVGGTMQTLNGERRIDGATVVIN